MSFRFAFMISLIFVLSCSDEKTVNFFTGNEAMAYEKILADHKAPDYKWGFLNEKGELAIEDKYDDLREFNEGLAAVSLFGLWGYIDKSGKEVIPPRFRTVKTFSEGIAVTQDLNGKFHLLDGNGKIIADSLEFQDVGKFQEGLSMINRGYLYGFLGTDGEIVIEPKYELVHPFSNGMALVQKNRKFGFIDKNDEVIIPIQYEKLWYPSEGIVRFKRNGKFGFLRLTTKKELAYDFASATDFYESYAVVNDGNSFMLLHNNGKIKTLPYKFVDTGGEGKWMYAADNRFGFLKNDGSVLTLPQYNLVMRYRDGRAGFAIDDKWGYLDEEGTITIPAQYPLVWDFVNGYARIISGYGIGFIDKSGNEVLPPQYMEARDFSEGLARIQVYR